jgi:dTDP-glucose 4,6-dehydratase
MIKVLITGGSGFIGSNLVNYLNKKRLYKISNIDKISYASTPEKFKKLKYKKNYKFYKLNLINKSKLKKILKIENPDFIIHAAAESHVDRSIDDPYGFFKKNINSTISLYSSVLELFQKNKINMPKIIQISSDEVYGDIAKGYSDEKSMLNPTSPYSSSKASSDLLAKSFMYTFNFQLIILRVCNNFGPYQFLEKFIPTILNKLSQKKKIPIYGSGDNVREWIYVEDTCRAIEYVIKNFKNGIDYNVGTNNRVSNLTMLKKIFYLKKLKKLNNYINFVYDRPAHDKRYALNSNKIRKNMKWSPTINLEEGLYKTIKWYLSNTQWLLSMKKKFTDRRIGKFQN